MMEHDFVYQITSMNEVIPILTISNNFIIKAIFSITQLLLLIGTIVRTVIIIALKEVTENIIQIYGYVFGSNHDYALIVFGIIGIVGLMIYDKFLFIETTNAINKSLRNRIDCLEDQIRLLKKKQDQNDDTLDLAYRRCYKEIEVLSTHVESRFHTLSKQIKKLGKEVDQYK
jgi:hypothetical protein